MKRAILAVAAVVAVLAPVAAQAALSPYWQSVKEITAIANDSQVRDALQYEEPILSIGLTAADEYEVRTERCTLSVKIVDKPAKPVLIGPRQFDIEVGAAACQ